MQLVHFLVFALRVQVRLSLSRGPLFRSLWVRRLRSTLFFQCPLLQLADLNFDNRQRCEFHAGCVQGSAEDARDLAGCPERSISKAEQIPLSSDISLSQDLCEADAFGSHDVTRMRALGFGLPA